MTCNSYRPDTASPLTYSARNAGIYEGTKLNLTTFYTRPCGKSRLRSATANSRPAIISMPPELTATGMLCMP